MNRLEGKVAIVTGGNAGIGEAVAKRFAEEGAAVVITGRRQAELDRVMSGIRHNKGKGLAVAGSVTDELHVRDVTQRTLDSFGRIDILVNNAGIGDFGKRIHETEDATWATLLDVNLTGVFRMTRAVVPQMLKQGRGAIVNISSVASLVGIPGAPAYAASKGGVDALTRALAIDYAKDGIRCNIVNPGSDRHADGRSADGQSGYASTDPESLCHPTAWDPRRSREHGAVSGIGRSGLGDGWDIHDRRRYDRVQGMNAMEIDATTQFCGVIGNPVEHSLSPAIHNAAFQKLGLNFVYLAWKVEADR